MFIKIKNISYKKNNSILLIIIIINILIQFIVFNNVTNKGRIPVSPDGKLYLDISNALRNFSGTFTPKFTKEHEWRHDEVGKLDIGAGIMPGYPLLISPFFENYHLIVLFQVLLFTFSLILFYKALTNKFFLIFVIINLFWIILSTSYPYHSSVLIESPTISILMILIYFLDRYLKDYHVRDFIWFSIIFGILIAVNNRYIFHYCGFIPFLLIIKFFEKRIKINHLIYSFLIVSAIMAPWHIRQYIVYEKFVLFSPNRNDFYENKKERDIKAINGIKIMAYSEYLLDSLNHPLKNNTKELEEARKLYFEKKIEDSIKFAELIRNGVNIKQNIKRLVFEPEQKKSIDLTKNETQNSAKSSKILQERLARIGIDEKGKSSDSDNEVKREATTVYTDNGKTTNQVIITKIRKQVSKQEKTNNQKINDLITQVNKINNTKFDGQNISVFVSQIDSLRFNNQTQYTKIIFDLINQADIAGLPDIKYTLLGIPKPIDSTLLAKNSQTPNSKPESQNPQKNKKSPKELTTNNLALKTNVDSLSFLVSNLRNGLDQFNKQATQSNDNSKNNQIAKNETKTNNKLEEKTKGNQGINNEKNKTQNKENKTIYDLSKNESKTSIQKLDEKKEQKPPNKQENQFVNKKSKEASKPTTKSDQQQNENISQLDLSKNEAKYSSVVNANKIDASNLASKVPTYQDSLYLYFKSNSLSKGTYKPESNLKRPNTTSDVVKNNSKSITKQDNQTINTKAIDVSKPTSKSQQQDFHVQSKSDNIKNEIKSASSIPLNKNDISNLASKVPTYQDSLYLYFKSNSVSKGTYKPESNLKGPNTTSDVVKNNSKSISKHENKTINTKAIDVSKPTSKSQQQDFDVQSKSDNIKNEIKSASSIPLNKNDISNLASKVPTYQDSLYLYFKSNSLSKGTYKPESNLKGPNTTSDVVKNNSKSISKQENKTINTKAIDVAKPSSKTQHQDLDVKSKSDIGTNETKSSSTIPLNQNEISNLASKVPTYQDSLYLYFKSNSLSKGTYKPESNLKGPNTTSDVVKNNSKSISKQENQKLSSKSIQATKATIKPQSQQKDILKTTEIAKNESKESNPNFTKNNETKNKSAKTIVDQNYQVSNTKLKDANNTKIQNVVNIKQDIKKSPIIENIIKPEDLKPILVINKVVSNESQNKITSKFRNDSIIIFPVLINNEATSKNKNIKQIRYDTLDLATVKKINSDIEKLNIRKQVVIENGRNRLTIEDNKVVMIRVGDFEDRNEFQKFENLRKRKGVATYNSIINALLENQPKLGESPEKLKEFLSDFSYSKYKQMVYDKPLADTKIEMIFERFKTIVTLYRVDFTFVTDWDPRIGYPSHYRNTIYHFLDIIMIPLMLINIIPLFIAIYKRDWFIISMFILVFLHLFLHALVNAPHRRYTTTIFPAWITFAVYGYDQITRYLIYLYKNRQTKFSFLINLLSTKKSII